MAKCKSHWMIIFRILQTVDQTGLEKRRFT